MEALGDFAIRGVADADEILLKKGEGYTGSPTPIGVQVFESCLLLFTS